MTGRVLAVLLALSTAQAVAQTPRGLDYAFVIADVNGNQRISEAEFRHFQNFLLLSIDQDADGRISAMEWRDWDPREYTGAHEGSVGQLVAAMARQFVVYDKDRNDYLSPEEFAGLFATFDAANSAGRGLDRAEFRNGFLLPKQLNR